MKAASITRFLHSSPMLTISAGLMVIAAVIAFESNNFEIIDEDRGFIFTSPNLWISNSNTAFWVNVAHSGVDDRHQPNVQLVAHHVVARCLAVSHHVNVNSGVAHSIGGHAVEHCFVAVFDIAVQHI
jgi:hypothetical protein